MTVSKSPLDSDDPKTPATPLTNGADMATGDAETPAAVAGEATTGDKPASGNGAGETAEAKAPVPAAKTDAPTGAAQTKSSTAQAGGSSGAAPSASGASTGTGSGDGGASQNRSGANPLMVVLAALLGALVAVLLTEGLRSNTIPAAVDAQLRGLADRVDAVNVAGGNEEAVDRVLQSITELRGRVLELESLRRDVDRLNAAGAGRGRASAEGVAALEGEYRELSDAMRQVETRISQLSGEVTRGQARLQDRVAALEAATGGADLMTRQDVADITERLVQLERNDVAQDARRAALAVSVANLSRSSDTGRPFANELQAVRILLERTPQMGPEIASIAPYAERGLPTIETLRQQYQALAPQVMRAWYRSENKGLFGRMWANLRGSVSVRPVGEVPGTTPPALLARAEQRLAGGDLAAAVNELSNLRGNAADVASDWLSAARSRIELDRMVSGLTNRVIADINGLAVVAPLPADPTANIPAEATVPAEDANTVEADEASAAPTTGDAPAPAPATGEAATATDAAAPQVPAETGGDAQVPDADAAAAPAAETDGAATGGTTTGETATGETATGETATGAPDAAATDTGAGETEASGDAATASEAATDEDAPATDDEPAEDGETTPQN